MEPNKVQIDELEVLVAEHKFGVLKNYFKEMLAADIAELIGIVPVKDALILYRLLSKDIAIEVFALIDVERQSELTSLVSEAKGAIVGALSGAVGGALGDLGGAMGGALGGYLSDLGDSMSFGISVDEMATTFVSLESSVRAAVSDMAGNMANEITSKIV